MFQSRYNETLTESTYTGILAITSSAVIIGAFVGAACVSSMLRIMGRKKLYQVANLIYIPGILLVALVGKSTGFYEVVVVGRIITGFPVGIGLSKKFLSRLFKLFKAVETFFLDSQLIFV